MSTNKSGEKYFSAAEARKRIREKQQSLLDKIYNEGIIPAIEDGEERCTVSVMLESAHPVPTWIISRLTGLGYAVRFPRNNSPRGDEFWEDKSSLEISWAGCEIHEPMISS